MTRPVQLTGIAWDHSRAFPPLVATAQRYEELHPGVRIRWEKRTLDEFGHMAIDQLAPRFDLIVIDHPWAGFAFEKKLVYDLKTLLPPTAFNHWAQNSIGATFDSYHYAGRLLALPIDAATPAPSWRPDLLERAGVPPPATWKDAIALARRKYAVMPAFQSDLFLHFLMLVKAVGSDLCSTPEEFAPRHAMWTALDLLRELTQFMPPEIFNWNPIDVAERMTTTDDFAWNAFAYTYNNYARSGFARSRLQFGNLVSLEPGGPRLRSVLGGTGVALSAQCRNPEVAADYASFIAGANIQRTLYVNTGGQPSHSSAWNDPAANVLCGGFFSGTKATQEEAFVRPRYSGYVPLQTSGGMALQETLRDGRSPESALNKLDELYRASRRNGSPSFQTN
ncbi:MAG TPA: ABC transporter substrate-binding protein [Verrucomicrobiae bacterium]|nr:ABC transporter substrate-binding protein [Verrucomicrobiae bacterium]